MQRIRVSFRVGDGVKSNLGAQVIRVNEESVANSLSGVVEIESSCQLILILSNFFDLW